MRIFICLVTIVAFIGQANLSTAQERVYSYPLKEGEFLFVCGKEYRELTFDFNAETGEAFISGNLIRSQKRRDEARTRNKTPGLSDIDTLYSRVPHISKDISQGKSFDQAKADYISIVGETWFWVIEVRKKFKSKELSHEEARAAFASKISSLPYSDCFQELDIDATGNVTWHTSSAPFSVLVTFSGRSGRKINHPDLEYYNTFLNFFTSEDGFQLLLLEYGMESYSLGMESTEAKVKQLRAAENTQTYVPGPISEDTIKNWGFILNEMGGQK
jgi:hypothetical protein